MAYRLKKAYLGGEGNDLSFEQMFAKIAFTYIQDKAPSLLRYAQGFQVVERNEDDTKALGVMGFSINGLQLYAPVFYAGGEIKGHELLRLVDQNLWIPLKEAWLHEIFRTQPISIGSPVERPEKGMREPDLDLLAVPPFKHASVRQIEAFCKRLVDYPNTELTKKACKDILSCDQPLAELARKVSASFDLPTHFKTAGLKGLKKLHSMLQSQPSVKMAFDQNYPDGFDRLDVEIKHRDSMRNSILRDMPWAKQAASVTIMRYSAVIDSPMPMGLTDKEKETLTTEGYLVQDARPSDEISEILWEEKGDEELFTPAHTGFYDTMLDTGEIKKRLVIVSPVSVEGCSDFYQAGPIIYDTDKNQATHIFSRDNLWCTKSYPVELAKWVQSQPTADSITTGKSYIFLSSLGTGTEVIKIESKINNTTYKSINGDIIIITPKGSRFSSKSPEKNFASGECHIPADWACLRVDDCVTRSIEVFPVASGSLSLIHGGVLKPAHYKQARYKGYKPLKVTVKSGECVINNKRAVPVFTGFQELITEHGLREAEAKEIIKRAEANTTVRLYIKYAMEAPVWPAKERTGPDFFKFKGRKAPDDEQFVLGYEETNPDVYRADSSTGYSDTDKAVFQQAIDRGQKEVFDVSAIKQLYVSADTDTDIEKALSKVAQGMNAAGDLLMLYYWKSDQFEEIYGSQRLPELEASIKKLFEIAGDVVLFLKRNKLNKADYKRLAPIDLGDNAE
ncbi:MAG: hypothetical protein Q4D38_00245 [Planctomycetia bacterium]|nr:hypothetical protein [Planctomycetia bacterium]